MVPGRLSNIVGQFHANVNVFTILIGYMSIFGGLNTHMKSFLKF